MPAEANRRSNTVVTTELLPSTSRTFAGTCLFRIFPDELSSKYGNAAKTFLSSFPSRESRGFTFLPSYKSSRFHFPSSPHLKPMLPFGIAVFPVWLSKITVFHSAFSVFKDRSDAVRKFVGAYNSSSFPTFSSSTRKGRSVYEEAYSSK